MPKQELTGDLTVHGSVEATNIGEKVYTVPVGTSPTGNEPDGSLWVEYEE